MKENEYRIIGWAIFLLTATIAFVWCLNQTGLAGWLIRTSQRLLQVQLIQISWLITALVLCLPGYMIKRYFDNLAWNEHLRRMPKPDLRDSAKRSKYVQLDAASAAAPAPKPVELSSIPKDQEEFIATCAACGHFFSAKKTVNDLKCPQCGESIQLQS